MSRPKLVLFLRPGERTIGQALTELAIKAGDPRVTPPAPIEPKSPTRAGADFSALPGLHHPAPLPWWLR